MDRFMKEGLKQMANEFTIKLFLIILLLAIYWIGPKDIASLISL